MHVSCSRYLSRTSNHHDRQPPPSQPSNHPTNQPIPPPPQIAGGGTPHPTFLLSSSLAHAPTRPHKANPSTQSTPKPANRDDNTSPNQFVQIRGRSDQQDCSLSFPINQSDSFRSQSQIRPAGISLDDRDGVPVVANLGANVLTIACEVAVGECCVGGRWDRVAGRAGAFCFR